MTCTAGEAEAGIAAGTRVPEVEFMGESKVEERLGLVADAVPGMVDMSRRRDWIGGEQRWGWRRPDRVA